MTAAATPEKWDAAAGCAVALLFLPIGAVTNGWVTVKLWTWFAVPVGLPPLGLAVTIGLVLLLRFALGHYSKEPPKIEGSHVGWHLGRGFSYSLVIPALVLGLGAITREFL